MLLNSYRFIKKEEKKKINTPYTFRWEPIVCIVALVSESLDTDARFVFPNKNQGALNFDIHSLIHFRI